MSEVPPGATAIGRRTALLATVVGSVAWVELATGLQLVRLPGRHPWQAIWAEDGRFFLSRAFEDPLGSVMQTHGGYYQVAARMIGSLASAVPVERAAAVFAFAGATAAALISLYVYFASAEVLRTRWARGLLAALVVLSPAGIFEVSANGLDLHWYFLFACFWALWSTARAGRRLVADALVVALATWSSPLTVVYAPLAVRRFVRGRGWGRWLVPGVFAVSAVGQASYFLTHRGGTRYSPFQAGQIPGIYAVRVAASAVVGDGLLQSAWANLGWVLAAAAVVVAGGLCLYAAIALEGRRLFVAAAAGCSAVLVLGAAVIRGTGESAVGGGDLSLAGSRYFFVPILLLTSVFVVVGESGGSWRWLRRLPAAVLAAGLLTNFNPPLTIRERAPDWGASLAAAEAQCRLAAESVDVAIAPGPPFWFVRVPCDRLRG